MSEVEGTRIDQIVIGSCTNGRLDDIEMAASDPQGQKVARGTRMLVFPASWRICRRPCVEGYLATLWTPARSS